MADTVLDLNTVTDFKKPAVDLIVELFNLKHGTGYTSDQFVTSLPSVGSVEGKNTDLILYGQQNTGLKGQVTVHYNRIAAHEILGNKDTLIFKSEETMVSDLLPLINEKYGVQIDKSEIIDAVLPVLDVNNALDVQSFALTFKGSALVYFGSVVLNIQQARTDIGTQYPDGDLPGFVFTAP